MRFSVGLSKFNSFQIFSVVAQPKCFGMFITFLFWSEYFKFTSFPQKHIEFVTVELSLKFVVSHSF